MGTTGPPTIRNTVWDARTGTPIVVLHGDTGPINAISISPGGRTLATASDDTTARLLDLTFAVPYNVLSAGSSTVDSLAFSGTGACCLRTWPGRGAVHGKPASVHGGDAALPGPFPDSTCLSA